MPGMDGVEVVRAVKHLRPDVDVVVITGYGTIETAVETLRHGACEYVQKPFTADELSEFVNGLLVKRRARQESLSLPSVRIVAPGHAEDGPGHELSVPGGAFIAPGHTWVRIESDGQLRLGIDDFARKAAGPLGKVAPPEAGREVAAGEPLFSFERDQETLVFRAPVSGRILEANPALAAEPQRVERTPYTDGWICRIQPSRFQEELPGLLIGQPVVAWYGEETLRLRGLAASQPGWAALQQVLAQ
jgi:glycine cleavage system H lipoate-binding protein